MSSRENVVAVDFLQDKRFLGHPKGMGTTSFMALAQAFGNYGMSAILIYYLYATAAKGGLDFSQANAAQFVSIYGSLSFIAGIVGGYVADRLIGIRKALYINFAVKTLGYLMLAYPGGPVLYFASQCCLLVASMCAGTSLYALAGKLYSKSDGRRDSGFSIMYIMNNVGAVAPVITGTIALLLNYHAGFLFAAGVQCLGLIVYMLTANKVFGTAGLEPDDPAPADKRTGFILRIVAVIVLLVAVIGGLFASGILTPTLFCNSVSAISIFIPMCYLYIIITSKKTSREEARRIGPFIGIFICNCFAQMIWWQSTSILAIYAAERVDLNFMGITLTPASFQTIPAVMAVIFGSVCSWLWIKMGNRQPSTPLKFGIGTIFWGLGPLFMVIPFLLYAADVKVSPLWLIIFYALIIWGEALTSPVGMAAASAVAPKAFTAQMMTVWQLSQSTGAGLSSLAVNFYHVGQEAQYFTGIGLATCFVGLLLWIFDKKATAILTGSNAQAS
ncbi:peptide MFS transporter [Sporomusa acidovorans]|uniref:Di-/tripeptide transporter n=1 Tax=Sporomusa acidovorans (strain ATCC 49682 / DSM 3132 / Mol) TaxID=1123286 RepID=A0ABZ3IXD5_SPOA4|nr:oligopeptide:H+ symporter [Sporomusa acidovorans]OZC22338.1 Di-/tripeptide transporter [Sporomusa acidovorans DSM 3132]SDE46166.1 proton-dependent oligopeptide transporter, POT family [Sporomusa acidovorans]